MNYIAGEKCKNINIHTRKFITISMVSIQL
jgi:hypothetical protein